MHTPAGLHQWLARNCCLALLPCTCIPKRTSVQMYESKEGPLIVPTLGLPSTSGGGAQ